MYKHFVYILYYIFTYLYFVLLGGSLIIHVKLLLEYIHIPAT